MSVTSVKDGGSLETNLLIYAKMGNAVEVLEQLVPESMDAISLTSVAHVFLEM